MVQDGRRRNWLGHACVAYETSSMYTEGCHDGIVNRSSAKTEIKIYVLDIPHPSAKWFAAS